MSFLGTGFGFLKDTLTTTVSYRATNQAPTDIQGVWVSKSFNRYRNVVSGAEQTDADATFHVAQTDWPDGVDRRARIVNAGQTYKILHVEPVLDSSYRLHLIREESRAGNPLRKRA